MSVYRRRTKCKNPRLLLKQELIDRIIDRAIELETILIVSDIINPEQTQYTKYRLYEVNHLIEILNLKRYYNERKGINEY